MLYLTGADASLAKSSEQPQSDVSKSLGGYISSTPVPNAALNNIFDLVSSYSIEKGQKETLAIGLINQFDKEVKNVELKIVTDIDVEATYKIAAVSCSNYQMEQIANRYQEPMLADFYDASFYRAGVNIKVNQYASLGEEIALYPFNVNVIVKETGIEGTWNAFEEAFSNNEIYSIKRISDLTYRIERNDELVLDTPLTCSYLTTEGFTASFDGNLRNLKNNTVLISNSILPKGAIGLWIQRIISVKKDYTSDDVLVKEYIDKYIKQDTEQVEIIINYDIVD